MTPERPTRDFYNPFMSLHLVSKAAKYATNQILVININNKVFLPGQDFIALTPLLFGVGEFFQLQVLSA